MKTLTSATYRPVKAPPQQNGDLKDEVLYTSVAGSQSKAPVKLETVVNLIDHVTDEMNFFKEKVCCPISAFVSV